MYRAYASYGGGVQSRTIWELAKRRDTRLLEASHGVLPELYIFADTGDEPRALYASITDVATEAREHGYRFQIVQTALGRLSEHVIHAARTGQKRCEQLPFFVQAQDGRFGPIKRHCTRHFKITPITAYARHHFGVHRGKTHDGAPVQMWLGISADEPQRLKAGPVHRQEWSEYFNPLAVMGWTRSDCISYLTALKISPQRSACVMCPFRSLAEWRRVKDIPEDWRVALAVDDALEHASTHGGAFGFNNPLFLTAQGVRLRDLDLRENDAARDDLMQNECAGVCGV
jgi:hypothetical protein